MAKYQPDAPVHLQSFSKTSRRAIPSLANCVERVPATLGQMAVLLYSTRSQSLRPYQTDAPLY